MKLDRFCRIGAFVSALLFAAFWFFAPTLHPDPTAQLLWKSLLSRALGSLVFVFVLLYLRYRTWSLPHLRDLLAVLPALAIALNNLPVLALLDGEARVDRTDLIWLYALEALLIGTFEELAFRGTLFLVVLEKYRVTTKEIFWTTVLSSAVFGLVHLVNLAEGAGFGATIMQVGYSFLIGGMCAIVLLKTGNLLYCILLHAIYDFCGGLLPTLGSGTWWDTPTVVFTVLLSVAVAAWMLWLLFHVRPEETDRFYRSYQRKDENHEKHVED